MVKFITISILMFFTMCDITQASEVNQKTLDLPITLLSGQTVKLSQYKGNRPVYLKFWATWCQPCRKEMPHLQHTFAKYGDKVQVIAINLGVNDDLKAVEAIKKEFGLTMPITIDKSGQLAQDFNLIGTPYHVLLDKNANIVHKGNEATKELDEKIKLLAEGKPITLTEAPAAAVAGTPIVMDKNAEKTTALFFVSTWCDWYLKESRPAVSKNCVDAQNQVNKLHQQFPQVNWLGVVSRLWTGEKELAEYKQKFKVSYPSSIDDTNEMFFNYGVKDFPTLIVINKGKEVFRTNHVDAKEVSKLLKKLSAR